MKNLNIENLFRSCVVLAVGLPIAFGLTSALGTADRLTTLAEKEVEKTSLADSLKEKLTEPCLGYALSKPDSKLERTSKNDIDEILGGEVNHRDVCNWVL